MTITDAIVARHSVRSYTSQPIEASKIETLQAAVADCNRLSGLNIKLVTNEPKAFSTRLAHYGKFSGVTNYFAMIGDKKMKQLDETIGYYGERLVLHAQRLGLNTCWVGLTYGKVPEALGLAKGEKLRCVIALGYGATQGVQHKSKTLEQVSKMATGQAMPLWFERGVEAALLAPTAVNQQKFRFTLHNENMVEATAGLGFFSHVDLGIVKYHFEQAAGTENFTWL